MIAPGLYAHVHQHFFVARMDMYVDCKPGESHNQVCIWSDTCSPTRRLACYAIRTLWIPPHATWILQLLTSCDVPPSSMTDSELKENGLVDKLSFLYLIFQDSNKSIQVEAFHVFKLFVANQKKHSEIVSMLIVNRSKLIRFFSDFSLEKADEQFEADKAEVVKVIATLELKGEPCSTLKQPEENSYQ